MSVTAIVAGLLGCDPALGLGGSRNDRSFEELAVALNLQVDLSPDDDSFEPLNVGIGMIAVSLDSLAMDPNGTLLHLRFGNPLSADLSRLSGTVSWGALDAAGNPEPVAGQSRNGLLVESITSGRWSVGRFLIPNLPPGRIGFVRIAEASVASIELRQ
jgi:hypothetical protein